MKTLLRAVLLCFGALVLMAGMLIFFGISDQPQTYIKLDWTMTPADIERAKKILREGSKTRPDEIGTIELSKEDLNLAANYLLNRFSKGRALIYLKENKLKFVVTATLPENRLGKYLNITFRLGNENGELRPTLTKFKAGKLLLPSKLAGFIIDTAIKYTSLNDYFILATDPIKAVRIEENKITLTYHPSRATINTARDILTHSVTATDNNQANIYQSKLDEIVRQHDPDWRLSLADLFRPLFALAYQRSKPETAIEENRTVIYTINNYVNAQKGETTAAGSRYYPAFLYKRIDLAQHFIGAAALTASVNSQVAQALGEEKELQDSQIGSGFSFIDLAADKAGTRFGELATASPDSARRLQQRMAVIKDYQDFMPDPRTLPEHMDEATFKKQYGAINSPAYKEVSKHIDALIAATPIFKEE